jgi:hypothetical protein
MLDNCLSKSWHWPALFSASLLSATCFFSESSNATYNRFEQVLIWMDKNLCTVSDGYYGSIGCLSSFQGRDKKLEPVCCKKQQKKSTWAVTGLWNRGRLKILNGIKLILDDQGNHLDTFEIIQVLQRSPILQTSNWSGTFFAVPFNKPALDRCLAYNEHTRRKLLYFVSYFAVKKCQNLIFKGNY